MGHHRCACGCVCHHATGILVLVFGLTFLLGGQGIISQATVQLVWPILVTIVGFKLTFGHLCGCCGKKDANESGGHGDGCC